MMYQCTKSHLSENQVIGRNVSLQVLLPEAVCCCLQTCNRRFVVRVIWCTSVPSFTCRKASTRVL